mgnify:FL=1
MKTLASNTKGVLYNFGMESSFWLTYFMAFAFLLKVLETNISALPWLEERKQQRKGEDEKEIHGKFGEPTFKPYKSGKWGICHDKVSVLHLQSDNLMKCKIKIINFIQYAWNDKRKQWFQDKLW